MEDFNLHINDPQDIEANQFLDTIDVLGLKQLVNYPTHEKNNTLDLIILDGLSALRPIYLKPGEFLSDHCTLDILLNVIRQELPIKENFLQEN